MNHLVSIAIGLAFGFAAYCVGRQVLALLKLSCSSEAERCAFGTAVGLAVLSYGVMVLGFAQLLRPWAVGIWLTLYVAISLPQVPPAARGLWAAARGGVPRGVGVLGIVLAAAIVTALFGTLVPPSSVEWDSLSYHLAAPKLFLKHGGIHYIPYDHHTSFPLTVEMLYTVGLMLKSTTIAKLFHLMMLVVACTAMVGLGRRFLPDVRLAGWLGAGAFATVPLVNYEAGIAYVDVALSCYGLLAIYALAAWWRDGSRGWLILAGVLAGLAMAIKYTGGLVFLLLLAAVVLRAARARLWRPLVVYAFTAAAVASPWYVRNIVYTRNPVYPFLYQVFDGRYWGPWQAEHYRYLQVHDFGIPDATGGGRRDPGALVASPYYLLTRPDYYFDKGSHPERTWPQSIVGPVFLLFLPIIVLLRRVPPLVWCLLGVVFALWLSWFYLMQHSRYLIAALAPASVCAGYAAGRLLEARLSLLRWVSGVALAATFAALTGVNAWIAASYGQVAFGGVSREQYLAETLSPYRAFAFINEWLPKDAKVALYGEPRAYYLDREYLWADQEHSTVIDYERMASPADLLRRYLQLGVTHVLINREYASRILRGEQDEGRLIEALRSQGLLRVEYDDGRVLLLRLAPPTRGIASSGAGYRVRGGAALRGRS